MFFDIASIKHFQSNLFLKPNTTGTSCDNPMVSVITACFNPLKDGRKELFLKSLNSVQLQQGVTIEHLIIDGGSTDGTLELLRKYNNNYHDIGILSMPDSGIYEAMNRGIALSRGKYVIFLNTDDYYHRTDGLALSVEALEKSECSFTFAPIKLIGPNTRHSPHLHPQRSLHKFLLFCTIPHPSMLFRKNALIEVEGYNQDFRLAADYDMMLRLVAKGHKGYFVDQNFVSFIANGFSSQNTQLNIKEKMVIIKNMHHRCFDTELSKQDAEFLVLNEFYPRKYLNIYLKAQQLIATSFHGLPQDVFNKFARSFNYVKYYLKCFFSFM